MNQNDAKAKLTGNKAGDGNKNHQKNQDKDQGNLWGDEESYDSEEGDEEFGLSSTPS